ncbi:MAG: HDOD domain-containing protein [Rhodanobacter sp.]
MSTTSATATSRDDVPASLQGETPLPIVRSPMLDNQGQLFAYELLFHRETLDTDEEAALMRRLLTTITDGVMTQLVRGNRAFLRLSRDLLLEQTDVLAHQPRLGIIVDPQSVADADLMQRLQQLSQRSCALLLDLSALDASGATPYSHLEPLLRLVKYVRLDASVLDASTLARQSEQLHERGLGVIAGNVDNHEVYGRCQRLPIQAVQGHYLLVPEQIEVPVLTASSLSMLRLMNALQENNPGPVELGEIVRDDAVLSYKLLGCVNSAYFALPRQLKSVQQAAIFFGASRMRNWIYTMALSGMDDRPPELLRTALIRAHMCERLAQGMPNEQQEMAFTTGLFSLLDTLMCAPMDYVLQHLPLAPEISSALLRQQGPFAPLLEQILRWEAGEMRSIDVQPQQIRRMASTYLEATRWADHIYSFAEAA